MLFEMFGNEALFRGDCLEVMDYLIDQGVKVDAIITDPPYGMNYQSNYRKNPHLKIANDVELKWLARWVEKAHLLAADNSAHYCFVSWHKIDFFKQEIEKFFTIKNILVWEKNKTSMGDLTGDFAPKVEFIIFFQKGRRKINGKRDPNIFKFNRTKNELHPTQKPVDMIEYLMEKFSDEGQVIFDPFMGSGTTGVACVNTNRKFIGIELDKNYFKIAQDRIDKARAEKV